MPNITNITPPRVPIVNETSGYVSREWYRWFYNIFVATGGTTQGIIQLENGGTSASTASQARTNLGLGTIATKNVGASGTFTTADSKTVTVTDGIITSIV